MKTQCARAGRFLNQFEFDRFSSFEPGDFRKIKSISPIYVKRENRDISTLDNGGRPKVKKTVFSYTGFYVRLLYRSRVRAEIHVRRKMYL